jgi:hypothetical protein
MQQTHYKNVETIHNYEYKWYSGSIAKAPNLCPIE